METSVKKNSFRKRKFRSQRRPKRKGFHGKRPQDIAKDAVEVGTCDHGDSATEVGQNVTIDRQPPTPVKSRTGQKLENSAFEEIIEPEGIFTRQKARELGFTKAQANIEKARGFKLQDAALISECISAAAICSSCKIPSSRLKLFQDNNKRDGLAEHLFFRCSYCEIEVHFNTSLKLGGKSGGTMEVNIRSLIASQRLGHSGLEKLCSTMKLPPPVDKITYNHYICMENVIQGSEAVN